MSVMTGLPVRSPSAVLLAACLSLPAPAQDSPGPPPLFEIECQSQFWQAPRRPVRLTPNALLEASFAQSTNAEPDGDGPSAVALTPDGAMALVANHTTGNIAVIDLNFLFTVATIPTPEYPEDIAITPDGMYALTADAYNNTVSIYDLSTFTLITSIPTGGSYPYRVEISADSTTAVVGCINDADVSAFTVIDIPQRVARRTFSSVSQGTIGSFFTFETGQTGYIYSQFGLTPDGSTIIAPDRINSRVVLYDAGTGAQLASLPCPSFPVAVSVSADGSRAAITHESGTNQLSVINIPARTLASFPTPAANVNQTVAITSDGSEAICVQSPASIVFTSTSTGAVLASLPIPTTPQNLVMYAGGTRLFASGNDAAIVSVSARSLIATIPQGTGYQAAAAEFGSIGVALNNRFREELLVYQLEPTPAALGITGTGAAPESDTPRTIALSPDGHTIIAANNISGNVCIWDITQPETLTLTDVGVRPLDVAYRADGLQAAVVAADSNRLSFIDLTPGANFGQVVTQVSTPARPVRVVYSNDGSLAYVLCIDAKLVIAVNTSTGAIVAQNSAGAPRISYAVSYLQLPDLRVSPDGTMLALCDAGTSGGRLRIYDTSNLNQLGLATTGSYPMRVVFSPDSSRAFVASYSTNSVAVIQLTGGPIAKIAGISTRTGPLTLDLDQAGQYLYIGCYNPTDPGLTIADALTYTPVQSISLDGYSARAAVYSPACAQLFITAESGADDRLYRVRAAGPSSAILDQFPLSWSASDVEYSRQRSTLIAAQPVFDTLDLFVFDISVDINADGVVDLADYFAFLEAFDSTLPSADLNDDQSVDLQDFFIFLAGFDAGCT
jgi:YVTN family beta-propeller protein